MSHKHILPVVLLLLFVQSLYYPAVAQRQNNKPNVIFILGDDIGFDLPNVNGGQGFKTPNIDSLAKKGINFTHCESTPMCSPSRVMFLTGKQNYRNYSNWGYLSDTVKMVGQMMREAGYTTGFFGKLQLQMHSPDNMNRWGWDRFTVFEISDDSVMSENRYKSPNLVDNAGRVPDSIVKDKYCDDILTSRIFNFIDSNKNKPFFAYYPMSIGHAPWCPTPDDPEYAAYNPDSGVSDTAFFTSMVNYMDKKVGQIVRKVQQAGLANNTIIIFAGDNGTPLQISYLSNGKKHSGEKCLPLEGGTHVPLMVYWPNTITPGINDDLVDFTDFFPTLAAIGGHTSLKTHAPLDGVSFYNRLFKRSGDSIRPNIFSHYCPNPGGLDDLERWVRDKTFKLYDTTSSKYNGKFYNIKVDPEEKSILDTNKLTPLQKATRKDFRRILDTTGLWPQCPVLNNASKSNITSNSAQLTGTIVSTGASAIIERGSTLSATALPTYRWHHQPDGATTTGTFSQTRLGLDAQTMYYYTMYAMNANAGNSTGYVLDSFYTLSGPPLRQPTSLQVADNSCGINVKWNNAAYPASGAKVAGYILVYSTNKIILNTNANGQPPSALVTDSKSRMVNLKTTLPKLPPVNTNINTLSKDSLYYFTLVPYTYDGTRNDTYNYLSDGVLSTTKKPSKNGCSAGAAQATGEEVITGISPSSSITPNPSRTNFTLHIEKRFAGKEIQIMITDAAGRIMQRSVMKRINTLILGSNWKPGMYVIRVTSGQQLGMYKAVKE